MLNFSPIWKARYSVCAAAALTLLLTGCASVTPPSKLDAISTRLGVTQQPTPAAAAAGVALGVPSRTWWQDFGDSALNTLVAQSMERNHELQATLASVREARSLASLAQREALPQGSFTAQAQQLQLSQPEVDPYRQGMTRVPEQSLLTVGQMVSWELDLFGRAGTAGAIAERHWDVARADAHAATALLQGEVVRQYLRLRQHQSELAIMDIERDTQQQRLAQMRARVQSGLADQREALAVESELVRLQAEQANMQAIVHSARAALAVLSGRAPTHSDATWESLMAPKLLPAVPASMVLKQPTDLLAQRPDVVKADALLRASLGQVVLAERAHLPRLSLNFAASMNERAADLGSAGALRYAAGPLLQWDWLNLGRNKARQAAAQAGSERAWHQLEQTVLKAIEDSEGALRQWVAVRQTLQHSQEAETAAGAASAYAGKRHHTGLEPAVQALAQQAQHLRARRATVGAQAAVAASYAQVQLALGAWQPESN